MESVTLGMDTGTAPDPRVPSDCNLAYLRRRAWAQSRDSWQESQSDNCGPQGPQQTQRDGEAQRPSEEPGQDPNKITSWLIECRTPLGASLDDQSASPNRGAPRNGCSFEDDLSLGAEANHLHSSNNQTQSCFDLAADQKRSRFKEKERSMNSTGSGKSSTVSSLSEVLQLSDEHRGEIPLNLCVSELLDLYEEDPEEILFNLGFGRDEPDAASRVPSRFIKNTSSARGIDVKVYLGAQLQRMELENPNYALTSRFRQIEVLTSVANEFFQLYSQVSGQPVQRIIHRDQGAEGGGGEEGGNEPTPPPPKRSSSALNVAKFLKKTISKQNLHAAVSESPEAHMPNQHTQLNGHGAPDQTNINGHAHTSSEQDLCSTDPDHRVEIVNQKHNRKKDNCSLATVTEETSGDGDADDSPEQNGTGTAADGEHQPESADPQSTNQQRCEGAEVVKEEEDKNMTSTPEKAPPNLVPLQLVQLRNENTDSFDMEEIQSNEDEAVPHRTSRATDLSRTVSQQSDSSGFAEEPSADSNSYLKVQESIDSCDSETTVTSHPSQDVATPIAVDQPVFELPDTAEEETRLVAEAHERSGPQEEDEHDQSSEQIPQYTAHHLLWNRPMGTQQDETIDEERVDSVDQTDAGTEPEITQSMSASKQEPQPELQHAQNQSTLKQNPQNQPESAAETEPPTNGADSEDWDEERYALLDNPSSPVHRALKRAKRKQLGRAGQWADPQSDDIPQIPQRGQERRRDGLPLQRSSSLPSSFLSPSRVMSSVKIQFGQGQVSCTQPRYSFKYTQESGGEEEDEDEEEHGNCLSTLIINPSSSSGSLNQPRLPTEASVPPKPIPRYLMQSTCALRSSSSLPDWSPGGHSHYGSTQSVPDLCSSRPQPNHFQYNSDHQNQQNWNPGQTIFPYHNPAVQYLNSSPNPSPTINPPLQYPFSFPSYASLPNCLHQYNPSSIHHCSLTSLHQPTAPPIPQHGSFSSLHQPSTFATPHNVSLGNLRPGTPVMHHQSFSHLYSHQLPYHATSHSSRVASPYLDFHGYNTNPNLAFPHLATQYPPLAPEHSLHTGHSPPAPGFLPGLDPTFGQGHNISPGFTPRALSSTEMQLRKVLHDIRGTVQSLGQNQANTPDGFNEHKAAQSTPQSLTELQQKRQSLNLFRCQMMDLESSITRQQALVYNHLSPADRLEVEQLRSLRSSVREELQELEQQLEDRLMELTHQTHYRGLHRGSSIDSLSTSAALRAMEPVSDLLREQLFLQSEVTYGGRSLSTNASSRSSSPVQGEGGACEQKQGRYRASININPVPPPRPNTHTEEEDGQRDRVGGGGGEKPQVEGAAGGEVGVGNLQDLIRQIRESVTQEVRREIYSELLATVSPKQTPMPSGQHSL